MTFIFDSAIPWLRKSGYATKVPGIFGECYRCHRYWEAKSREMTKHFLAKSKETDSYLMTPYVRGLDGFFGTET